MNKKENRYKVIDSIVQDMSFAIKDIQGYDGVVVRSKSKYLIDNICMDLNKGWRLSCCKQSSATNGWRHDTSCENYVICY